MLKGLTKSPDRQELGPRQRAQTQAVTRDSSPRHPHSAEVADTKVKTRGPRLHTRRCQKQLMLRQLPRPECLFERETRAPARGSETARPSSVALMSHLRNHETPDRESRRRHERQAPPRLIGVVLAAYFLRPEPASSHCSPLTCPSGFRPGLEALECVPVGPLPPRRSSANSPLARRTHSPRRLRSSPSRRDRTGQGTCRGCPSVHRKGVPRLSLSSEV